MSKLFFHEKRLTSWGVEETSIDSRNRNALLNISEVVCSKAVPGAKAMLMARIGQCESFGLLSPLEKISPECQALACWAP